MNRKHAQAIIDNLELIKHFAVGGEIVHILHDASGRFVKEWPADSIILGNLSCKPNMTYYKIVKPRYKFNATSKCFERL